MIRWVVGLAGAAAGGYGAWLLLDGQEPSQLVDVAVWLASGVLVHDVLVAALALTGALAVGRLPAASRAPAAVALVVVGSLTLVAVPMLGGFGERADNPTHLDRPYLAAWVGLVLGAAVVVLVAGVVRARKREA